MRNGSEQEAKRVIRYPDDRPPKALGLGLSKVGDELLVDFEDAAGKFRRRKVTLTGPGSFSIAEVPQEANSKDHKDSNT